MKIEDGSEERKEEELSNEWLRGKAVRGQYEEPDRMIINQILHLIPLSKPRLRVSYKSISAKHSQ